jgi:5-methylcytosine-specific restriction endonuclease McrA
MKRRYSKSKRDAVKLRWPHCAFCRQPYGHGARQFTIDHLLPLYRGGGKELDNLVGCCAACNIAKGCRTPQEWLTELADAVRTLEAMQGDTMMPAGVLSAG